jgi:hypothetical protein
MVNRAVLPRMNWVRFVRPAFLFAAFGFLGRLNMGAVIALSRCETKAGFGESLVQAGLVGKRVRSSQNTKARSLFIRGAVNRGSRCWNPSNVR